MNALTKLFSFKPAKKSMKPSIALIALSVVALMAASGCIPPEDESVGGSSPKFLSINVADSSTPNVHTSVSFPPAADLETISTDAATGTPTGIVSLGKSLGLAEWVPATYSYTATGSAAVLDTYAARAYPLNLSVVLGTFAAPLIRNIGIAPVVTPNVILMQADHTIGDIDIYVTAPGTNLNTVGPDAAGRGYGNYTVMNAIHTGATFQVRATLAGTKTVVADFGTTTGAKERTNYVFVMAEVGGAKMLRNLEYTQD
jgi:hypothetical protein